MSEQEWDDLASSISRLRTAVVVLVVVIVLFCILQIISLIYKATMMRKNSQKRKAERMSRMIAAGRKKKRLASRSSDRRRNIPKYKRSEDVEPSKKATIRLSLSHEDDQRVESRKRTNEQVEKKNKKSQSLSEGSLTVEAALPLGRRGNAGVPPEPTGGKGNTELSNTTKDAPPQAANVDPSIAAATVDKSDEKMPKAPEPPQEVKRTDDQATNLVAKDPALVISNDQKPLPVEKDIAANVKGTENKSSGVSGESTSPKKDAAVIEIPETPSTNASTANESSKVTAKPAPPVTDSTKSAESSSGGKPTPASGKVLELKIGI
uniref:Uncharacterized protein n=1 Tax=Ascaris lumbricoides TaxID=6252 RepID=A0A0M3I506_ASCLU